MAKAEFRKSVWERCGAPADRGEGPGPADGTGNGHREDAGERVAATEGLARIGHILEDCDEEFLASRVRGGKAESGMITRGFIGSMRGRRLRDCGEA